MTIGITGHAVERYLQRVRGELIVVTLWEEGEDPAVPRRFTDALRSPRRVAD